MSPLLPHPDNLPLDPTTMPRRQVTVGFTALDNPPNRQLGTSDHFVSIGATPPQGTGQFCVPSTVSGTTTTRVGFTPSPRVNSCEDSQSNGAEVGALRRTLPEVSSPSVTTVAHAATSTPTDSGPRCPTCPRALSWRGCESCTRAVLWALSERVHGDGSFVVGGEL